MRLRRSALTTFVTGAALALSATVAPPASAAPAPARLAPVSAQVAKDLASLPLGTLYGAYVTVRGGTAASRAALLADHGLTVSADFPSVGTVYGAGTLGAVATLRRDPAVTYVSTSRRLKALDDTSGWALRVEQAQRAGGNGPYRDASGGLIDGRGVGVAVVDSGIDGTHPDLAGRVVRNTKFKCTTPVAGSTSTGLCYGPVVSVPLVNTDPSSGHGSHVAGIVAGDGTASNGTFRGVAPGASLYGYAVGDGDSIFDYDVAAAFQDILTTNANGTNSPRIRVATNSWGNGAGSAYDPDDIISTLTRALVASGVTVLYAAGNGDVTGDGGDGSDDRLSSTAKDPTPGVITVANYDDAGTGTRNGQLDTSSSRGKKGVPADYPDVSAPGALITSTCRAVQPICAALGLPESRWAPMYTQLSGTSMATPAVAGIAAMLYQAKPSLTPAQVEDVLQDTAYKFGLASTYEADPQNAGGTTSFDKGAGLVDLEAALRALGTAHDGGDSAQGDPTVDVLSPAPGLVSDATSAITVSGTAADGYVAPQPFVTQVVAAGDGGDLPAPFPGAADVTGLTATETATGVRYAIGVRDLDDLGPYDSEFVIRQNVNGAVKATDVSWDGTAVTISDPDASFNTAVASSATVDRASSSIVVTVPFTALGVGSAPTYAYQVYVQTYQGVSVDLTPGSVVVANAVRPEYGSYLLRRPSASLPPTTAVTLSVDGGAAKPVTLSGTSPSYTWSSSIDPTALVDGTHTLTATTLVNGVARATRTVSFVVQRPVVVVSSLEVTSPAEGAVLDRGLTTVTGTATTNAPASQVRKVTVQVTGAGYDSGELLADGTGAWSLPLDAGALVGGAYAITARLSLDGTVVATATRNVTVPAAPVLVSCSPRGLSFWQEQYNGSRKAVFTTAEATALADKAVALSNGYFGSRSALVNVLYAKGKLPAETTTARQYAPLLLNLAAGQLSATMSTQLGLAGTEALDPTVYDVAKVGSTAGAAAGWVRAQLPSGDLAGAEQVAISLNTRSGLTC